MILALCGVMLCLNHADTVYAADPAASERITKEGPSSMNAGLEKKVNDLLQLLTLEEKVGLCSGNGNFRGVARLNIPDLILSDGPRGPNGGGPATAFPACVMFGSTWNPELIEQVGKVMGTESRSKGIGILLGPGINIQRDPLGGRFFEYYTEDPYLNSRLAVAIVKGIQSEGVAACLKHYACNNREENRNFYMSMVDQRTLHEIYLPVFKASVQESHAWSVMTSANGVNGEFVSDSAILLNDILKKAWGFDGVVLTDWLQTRSTEKAALAGLDISMPGGECGFAKPLLAAVKEGRVPVSVLDDKARRILRMYGRIGLLDQRKLSEGAARNTLQHQDLARRVAEEGIVLLKNSTQLLPLDPESLKNVLVVGPNADQRFCVPGLGGSSWVSGPHEITPLAGIRNVLGDKVRYLSTDDLGGFQPIPASLVKTMDGQQGFQAKYYAKGKDKPAVERVEPQINFMWEMRSPDATIPPDGFQADFIGQIIPPTSGNYTLRVTAGGNAWVFVEKGGGAPTAIADRAMGIPSATALIQMQKGKPVYLHIRYTRQPGDASLSLTWQPPASPEQSWVKVEEAARAADAVIVVAGLDHNLDTEGRDRSDMEFPSVQQALINRVAQQNSNTVVVLVNGSPLELGGWLPNVSSVVEAWYPGMEGGHAIAGVLFGRVNPSGRLPFTWPKKLQDSPSWKLGTQTLDRVDYTEGLMVGYRYFDTKQVEPEFPFGYGLSYTTFSFKDLQVRKQKGRVYASITVGNTGKRDGLATVQFYVRPMKPSVARPAHELKAFQKIAVKAGQSERVEVELGADAFSYFDETAQAWKVDPGRYEIQACSSSRDVLVTSPITIDALTFQ
jgi:beta-glucosidase